jgi:hypothetical protein
MWVAKGTKSRTVRNFPLQANGAEMLRLACIELTEAGVRVCAPVHDALLVEAPSDSIGEVVRQCQDAMARASAAVLGGFALRTDAKVISYPDRFEDPRGREMWKKVSELIGQPHEDLIAPTPQTSPIFCRPVVEAGDVRVGCHALAFVGGGRRGQPGASVDTCLDTATTMGFHQPEWVTGEFLRGPLYVEWLRPVLSARRGVALRVALAVQFALGRVPGMDTPVGLTTAVLKRFGIDNRDAKDDGLAFIESAGMVTVTRKAGKNPLVTVRAGPGGRYVRGPIPLSWLSRACALPGQRVLAVSLALWYVRGLRSKNHDLEVTADTWELFGVDAAARCRALKDLTNAGLVEVEDLPGRRRLFGLVVGERTAEAA